MIHSNVSIITFYFNLVKSITKLNILNIKVNI